MARIIIADDDDIVADIVVTTLMAEGHAVGWLSDGTAAMEVITQRKPQLVILDCNMPGIGGIDVVRKLRRMPDFYDLPILMLTGRQGMNDEQIARFEGANDYLRKPFEPMELVDRVETLLGGRKHLA